MVDGVALQRHLDMSPSTGRVSGQSPLMYACFYLYVISVEHIPFGYRIMTAFDLYLNSIFLLLKYEYIVKLWI